MTDREHVAPLKRPEHIFPRRREGIAIVMYQDYCMANNLKVRRWEDLPDDLRNAYLAVVDAHERIGPSRVAQ